jgi:alkylhydroperoxidase family enzyme
MPWTPWIKIESEDTSNVQAKNLYERTRNPVTQKISDLTRITSLTSQTSELIDKLCAAVYRNATGLSTREKEIAALIVSSLNGCVH